MLGIKRKYSRNLYAYDSQAAFAMLACAELEYPFSSFGGFAPHELAIRIDDCKPRLIIRLLE
jgi:propionyl-CoA synthetase